jgi:hypothetical protein
VYSLLGVCCPTLLSLLLGSGTVRSNVAIFLPNSLQRYPINSGYKDIRIGRSQEGLVYIML